MRKIILSLFCTVVIVNFILLILLDAQEIIERTDMIALLIGSYIIYWAINIYLYIQIKLKNSMGYSLTLIVGMVASIIALFVLLFNLKTDKSIYVPLMFVISMLAAFFNWFIYDHRNSKKP